MSKRVIYCPECRSENVEDVVTSKAECYSIDEIANGGGRPRQSEPSWHLLRCLNCGYERGYIEGLTKSSVGQVLGLDEEHEP